MYQDYNNMFNQYYGYMETPAYRRFPSPQQSDEIITFNQSIDLIRKSIESEKEDALFYEELIKLAPSEKEKNIITGIRDNERKHAQIFRNLYYKFTGQMLSQDNFGMSHQQNITGINTSQATNNNANYKEKLEKALFGELNAIITYRRIMGAMPDDDSYILLMSIMTDEIRHSSLYNYLIHKAH